MRGHCLSQNTQPLSEAMPLIAQNTLIHLFTPPPTFLKFSLSIFGYLPAQSESTALRSRNIASANEHCISQIAAASSRVQQRSIASVQRYRLAKLGDIFSKDTLPRSGPSQESLSHYCMYVWKLIPPPPPRPNLPPLFYESCIHPCKGDYPHHPEHVTLFRHERRKIMLSLLSRAYLKPSDQTSRCCKTGWDIKYSQRLWGVRINHPSLPRPPSPSSCPSWSDGVISMSTHYKCDIIWAQWDGTDNTVLAILITSNTLHASRNIGE